MSLISVFMDEIELIQDDNIREFVVESLDQVGEFYNYMPRYIAVTKKSIEYSKSFLEVLDATDYVNDIIASALLLQDITRYYEDVDEGGEDCVVEDHMHPLSVRQRLLPLANTLGLEKFDDIMRTIESSHGLSSPIPQVMPTLEDPIHIWILPLVNRISEEVTA